MLAVAHEDCSVSLRDAAGLEAGRITQEGRVAALAWSPSQQTEMCGLLMTASQGSWGWRQTLLTEGCHCREGDSELLALASSDVGGAYLRFYDAEGRPVAGTASVESPVTSLAYMSPGSSPDRVALWVHDPHICLSSCPIKMLCCRSSLGSKRR